MKNGAYQKWKKLFSPTGWMWTKKRQVFLKKDTSGELRSFPHSPRSVPTNVDVSSESELIHYNISMAEPISSGSNRDLSISIQELVPRSQRGGVGNMPKPLAGGHELLLRHQELSGSGEEHRTIRRMEPIFLKRKGQKDKEMVEKSRSFIYRPEEGTGNDSSFEEGRPSGN
ncbi:hypothetical protein O181_008174 [Austropuccinia psidii MF-1]|uniref:Uncharacterized protein n=1 Tax=Austropuccinia psidii MF-1 TaxID=1389203 RepID=A0A9Q3GIL6_9BASI|nr:hypothetical protein [Austropuccinia psidii MF-1]